MTIYITYKVIYLFKKLRADANKLQQYNNMYRDIKTIM